MASKPTAFMTAGHTLAFVTTAGVAGLAAAVAVSLAAATGATLVSAVEVG